MHFSRAQSCPMSAREDAEQFGELFAALYHRFHRHDPVGDWQPSPEALALMEHLSRSGPLTVREAERHFQRSQAATSELLTRLEKRGLLERVADERDRRRTLVWLSELGLRVWRESRRVLDVDRLSRTMNTLSAKQRSQLLHSFRELLDRGVRPHHPPRPEET